MTRTPTPEEIQPQPTAPKSFEIIDDNLDTPPPRTPSRSPSPEPIRSDKPKTHRRPHSEHVKEEEVQRRVRIDFETKRDKIYNPFEDKIHDADIPISDMNHQAKARRLSFDSQKSQVTTAESYFNYEAHVKKRGSIEDLDYRIMNTGYGRGANSVGFQESNYVVRNSSSAKLSRKNQSPSAAQAFNPLEINNLPEELKHSPYLHRKNSATRGKKT